MLACTNNKGQSQRAKSPPTTLYNAQHTSAQVEGEPVSRYIPHGSKLEVLKTPGTLTHATLYSKFKVLAWPDPLPESASGFPWIKPGTICYAVYNEVVERHKYDHQLKFDNLYIETYARTDGCLRVQLHYQTHMWNNLRHTFVNQTSRARVYVLGQDGRVIKEEQGQIGVTSWFNKGEASGQRIDNLLLNAEEASQARFLAARCISEARGTTMGKTTVYKNKDTIEGHPGVVLSISSKRFLAEVAPQLHERSPHDGGVIEVDGWTILRLPSSSRR